MNSQANPLIFSRLPIKTAKALARKLVDHGRNEEVAASLAEEERDPSINPILIYADQDNDKPVLEVMNISSTLNYG